MYVDMTFNQKTTNWSNGLQCCRYPSHPESSRETMIRNREAKANMNKLLETKKIGHPRFGGGARQYISEESLNIQPSHVMKRLVSHAGCIKAPAGVALPHVLVIEYPSFRASKHRVCTSDVLKHENMFGYIREFCSGTVLKQKLGTGCIMFPILSGKFCGGPMWSMFEIAAPGGESELLNDLHHQCYC